tara:strand:- start:11902 stop:14154 length:2253 start_codon:yes stop_codon:yes gene_type:complete
MIVLIDWEKIIDADTEEVGSQKLRVLEQNVYVTSPHLRLLLNNNELSLILISGPDSKERSYSLSNAFIPSSGGIIPVSQSPFVISIINYLNASVLRYPPTSLTSHKRFKEQVSTALLVSEYFALKGKSGLTGVTKSDVTAFVKDIGSGWFVALSLQSRFERFTALQSPDWFDKQRSKKSEAARFKIEQFKKDIGTSIIDKTLNDLPPSIVDKLQVPPNIRTPYRYSDKFDEDLVVNELVDVYTRVNELFFSTGLAKPISDVTEKAKKQGVQRANRTQTATVDEVYRFGKYLFSALKLSKTATVGINAHRKIIIDESLGSWIREKAVKAEQTKLKPITIGDKDLDIRGYRQGRSVKNLDVQKKEAVTLSELYQIYVGAVANLVMMFTGWRLNEVVHPDIGLGAQHVNFDPQNRLTIINRSIEKSDADVYERQNAAVGPLVGSVLMQLHENNKAVAIKYDDKGSLFSVMLAGSNGGSKISAELSSNKREQNPLRYFAEEQNITVPTPRQLRRYFAVVYFYQFDHPQIMALSNHYGHSNLETTDGYVTDTPSRHSTKSIGDAIPFKNISTSDDSEFRKIFEGARDAKLKDLVAQALGGKSRAGFQKSARAIFRKIYTDTVFDELDSVGQEKVVDDIYNQVKSEGYSVEVYLHGNCTSSSKHANSSSAKCGNEIGEMEREHASAELCSGCGFHDVQKQHIKNIKMELHALQDSSDDIDDIFGCTKTPIERAQDNKKITELTAIIALYEDDEYAS